MYFVKYTFEYYCITNGDRIPLLYETLKKFFTFPGQVWK